MIRIEIEGSVSLAEVVEAAIWFLFCVSGVGVGMAASRWEHLFTPIAIGYGSIYLVLAVGITRRKLARGDTEHLWL